MNNALWQQYLSVEIFMALWYEYEHAHIRFLSSAKRIDPQKVRSLNWRIKIFEECLELKTTIHKFKFKSYFDKTTEWHSVYLVFFTYRINIHRALHELLWKILFWSQSKMEVANDIKKSIMLINIIFKKLSLSYAKQH